MVKWNYIITVLTLFWRLHSELKNAVEKQLETLPFGIDTGNDMYTDDETAKNLREQLQLANQVSDVNFFKLYSE